MPGGDGTGPAGAGPMTGRRSGFCAGSGQPGFATRPGFGGGGRGNRFWFRLTGLPGWARAYGAQEAPAASPEMGRSALERRAQVLREQLEAVEKRLEELS